MSLLLLNLANAYASDWVYLVDSRHPQERDNIFTQGFRAWGNNQNLLDHVSGRSAGSSTQGATSFYISTTSDYNSAPMVARESTRLGTTALFWVYQIRAFSNFYDIRNSLVYVTNDATVAPQNRTQATTLRFAFDWQAEIAAAGNIMPSQINTAQLLTVRPDGSVFSGEVRTNLQYQNVNTNISPTILPLNGVIQDVEMPVVPH